MIVFYSPNKKTKSVTRAQQCLWRSLLSAQSFVCRWRENPVLSEAVYTASSPTALSAFVFKFRMDHSTQPGFSAFLSNSHLREIRSMKINTRKIKVLYSNNNWWLCRYKITSQFAFFFSFSFLFSSFRPLDRRKKKQAVLLLLRLVARQRTQVPPWWLCPRRVTDLVTVLFWASQERRVKQKVRW